MNKKIIFGSLLLAGFGATMALAGPIEDRQALMKQFGGVSRTLGGMARGTAPYDATAANTQLQVLIDGAGKLPGMFPPGSDTGAKTGALPTVWSDSAGFAAAAAKLGNDAKAAQGVADQAAFATAFQTVQADCGACHKTFRAAPAPAAPPPPAPAQ